MDTKRWWSVSPSYCVPRDAGMDTSKKREGEPIFFNGSPAFKTPNGRIIPCLNCGTFYCGAHGWFPEIPREDIPDLTDPRELYPQKWTVGQGVYIDCWQFKVRGTVVRILPGGVEVQTQETCLHQFHIDDKGDFYSSPYGLCDPAFGPPTLYTREEFEAREAAQAAYYEAHREAWEEQAQKEAIARAAAEAAMSWWEKLVRFLGSR